MSKKNAKRTQQMRLRPLNFLTSFKGLGFGGHISIYLPWVADFFTTTLSNNKFPQNLKFLKPMQKNV